MVQPASRLGAEQENEPNEWMERQGAGDDRNSGRNPHCPDRADQTPGPALPIWVVHIGDNLYVRSYRGPRALVSPRPAQWRWTDLLSGHAMVV